GLAAAFHANPQRSACITGECGPHPIAFDHNLLTGAGGCLEDLTVLNFDFFASAALDILRLRASVLHGGVPGGRHRGGDSSDDGWPLADEDRGDHEDGTHLLNSATGLQFDLATRL